MAIRRTRKDKETPNYKFLLTGYSWQPRPHSEARVKGESKIEIKSNNLKASASKRADIQAKDEASGRTKKDIVRSIILVSFILALEIVIYLAWKRFLS